MMPTEAESLLKKLPKQEEAAALQKASMQEGALVESGGQISSQKPEINSFERIMGSIKNPQIGPNTGEESVGIEAIAARIARYA
ncbi:hypothetical protein [Bartonella sp. DGB2]|uniref:hypothetical protein n=1 Tax=Bartonella sp. DGB2 TaxID=3388426 RepID=UPI00398FF00F